jgi:hypothetical protein
MKALRSQLLALAKGTLSKKTILYGGYTGSISNFGASFYADNGQAMTCLISTRYMAPMGESVQEQYRRFFLNVDPVMWASLKPSPVTFGRTLGAASS